MPLADELVVYARVRTEMDRLVDHIEIPAEIRDFLLNQWTRLMTGLFMARGDQDADWRAGWETANGLVYSLLPKNSVAETEQFLRELPRLLWRLHEGCTALGMHSNLRDALFSHLALHHAAIARDGLQIDKTHSHSHIGEVYEAEVEADEVAFSLNEPHSRLDQRTGSVPINLDEIADTPPGLPELLQGDRVGFKQAHGECVLVLTGKSPMGGVYMFTNEDGRDAKTYTHARLLAKFRNGEARFIR